MSELSLLTRIELARLGGGVERCHMVPHQGSYSNAAHSWGVALLMLQLFPEDFPRLAAYCITHDIPEAWVGDIPAHTKQRAPAIGQALEAMENQIFDRLQLPRESNLQGEDRAKLKACDALELYMWSHEQVRLGNHHAGEILVKLSSWFENNEHRPLPPAAAAFYNRYKMMRGPVDKTLALENY